MDGLDNVPRSLVPNRDVELTVTLSALTDSVLADLWDNQKDEAYDKLRAG